MSDIFLHAFEHGIREAMEIAQPLGVSVAPIQTHHFPDGESLVTVSNASKHAVVYCSLEHPNSRLIELFLAADALRQNGARRLILIAPYLCYMRQDKAFHVGEAVSQQVIGRLLAGAFDKIITVDPHLHRVKAISDVFPGIESVCISAAPAIAAFVNARSDIRPNFVVGPDSESKQWVDQIAQLLDCESIIGLKNRMGDQSVEISFPEKQLDGKSVLLVDDIVSSGATIIEAIRKLKHCGAGEVNVAITHALFTREADKNMRGAGAKEIWSTYSVLHWTNKISLAELFIEILKDETGPAT